MESSCGSLKSAFDETDVVTLTLMEKRNNISDPVKTIKVDPLSVDFYSPKITLKQFKILAEQEIRERIEYCGFMCKVYRGYTFKDKHLLICPNGCWTFKCGEIKDYSQSLAEMEKFVKIMKCLELFGDRSPSCEVNDEIARNRPYGSVELDNKTASSFPKLNENHYFIASFTDTKNQKSVTTELKNYKII